MVLAQVLLHHGDFLAMNKQLKKQPIQELVKNQSRNALRKGCDNMAAKEGLKKIRDIIESWDSCVLPKKYGPYTVSLVDEEFPNGMVQFRDCNGTIRLAMPREDYDYIVENKVRDEKASN